MPRNLPVAQVMTTDVLSFSPDDRLDAAMASLVERGVDGAPVIDADGRVVGMISTGDLIVQESQVHVPTVISLFGAYLELPSSARRFEDDLRKALGGTVGEAMTSDPVTITEEASVGEAATLMHDREVSRLPVVRDDRLVGIVARADIVRAIINDRS